MRITDTVVGDQFNLGQKAFSSSEIIEFAKVNDPLSFHLSEENAKNSRFKGLVTSGSQAFNFFYVNHWVPKWGATVTAGLRLNNWNFIRPIYANDLIHASCTINNKKSTKLASEIVVVWRFEFINSDQQMVQELELTVLHKIIEQ